MMYKHLTYDDRKQIEKLYNSGKSIKEIADIIKIHFTTLYREINRGCTSELDKNGRFKYDAELSQRKFCERAKQRGTKK